VGSSCASAGAAGNINTTVTLLKDGTATFVVTANTSSGASGNLVNAATVTAPGSSPNSPNACTVAGSTYDAGQKSCTSTDTDTPAAVNLAITKTDNVNGYPPGGTITYTIVVSNTTGTATDATVTDTKPTQVASWNWTCTNNAGASGCTPTGGAVATNFSD
jgi:uncharacterized repeat protein (TIGR01451 family)